jgi:hypothetical protein
MKNVLLVACIACITIAVSAQSKPSQGVENNLYSMALKTSILQMEKEYGHMDDSVLGENMRTDYRHLIVEKDPLITDDLPTEFENHFVEYLDNQGLVERYKKLGKSYAVLVIRPIRNEGATLKIALVVYWVSYKKRRLQLGLSDWGEVEFRYDCDKQQFIVSSLKLGGI